MRKVLKAIGLSVLILVIATLIALPLNYLFYKVLGPVGKAIEIIVLFAIMCGLSYYTINGLKQPEENGNNQ